MKIDWKETAQRTTKITQEIENYLDEWKLLHSSWEVFVFFENYPPRIKVSFRKYSIDNRRKESYSGNNFYLSELKPKDLDELTDLITYFANTYNLKIVKSIYKGRITYTMWIKQK